MLPGASTLTTGGLAPTPTANARSGISQQRMLEMMDEKQILQYEIEQEKDKIAAREKKQRDALET